MSRQSQPIPQTQQIAVCDYCGEWCRDLCSKCGKLFCNDCMPDGYITLVDEETGKDLLVCEECHPDYGFRCPACGQVYPEKKFELKSDAHSRNAPCPCGSGKKYKKCCGRTKPDA